jgi:hypothetical protein
MEQRTALTVAEKQDRAIKNASDGVLIVNRISPVAVQDVTVNRTYRHGKAALEARMLTLSE